MARIRTIKPEFFRSRVLSECSLRARLTFIGLWTVCDDEGRYRYEPELLKADLWPFEEDITAKDVNADVLELEAHGLVCCYETAGKRYLHIVNWHEHQKINRPTPSRLPECSRETHGALSESSTLEVEKEVDKALPTHPDTYGPPLVVHNGSVDNQSKSSQRRAKLRDPIGVGDALAPVTGQKPSRPTRDQLRWREEADNRAAAERALREAGP